MGYERGETEPIRGPVSPQGPYASTTPISGRLGGPRTPRPPTRLLLGAAAALVAVFVIGYLVGNAGDGPEPAQEQQQAGGGGGGGGGSACRRAVNLASQVMELQRAALQNRAQFTRDALAGSQERLAALNEALQPLSEQLQQLEPRANAAGEKCRRRGGGGGGGGGG